MDLKILAVTLVMLSSSEAGKRPCTTNSNCWGARSICRSGVCKECINDSDCTVLNRDFCHTNGLCYDKCDTQQRSENECPSDYPNCARNEMTRFCYYVLSCRGQYFQCTCEIHSLIPGYF